MSPAALFTRARSPRRDTIVPVRSPIAARSHSRPTSIPTTQPADGLSS
jgi:hypothetical protein